MPLNGQEEIRWFSLRRLFTGDHLKGRLVITLRVYLDESEGDTAFVASGWACRAERWDDISAAWQKALDSDPAIPYFKLHDAMALEGPFAGWSEKKRDAKVIRLAQSLPHEDRFFGTGCHVARSDFAAIKNRMRQIYASPYYFCVATAMIYAADPNSTAQIVGVDKIDFVLDRSNAAMRMCRLFYAEIKPLFPRLGECIHLDDKETPALQAADLNVGLVRQQYEPNGRTLPGAYALNGIFSGPLELNPKVLEHIITLPLFKRFPQNRAITASSPTAP